MTWEHFCDKAAYEWSDSTTLGMISKIDSLGTAEQIIEMVEYHLDDDSSKRLLNRAIKDKVLFTPEQAVYVVEEYMEEKQANRLIQSMLDDGIKFPADIIVSRLRHEVSEAVLNRLVKEGADGVFSEEEIEELEGVVDDDVLRSAVAGVMNSDDIGTEIQNHLDEYLSEEDMRRSLDRILDAAGMTLTAQQVCDMAQDMYEDVADVLVRDVVDRGMKFTTDQVMQLIDIVTQPVMEHLVSHTEGPFSEAELERLDGKINDLLLVDVTGLSDGELELADEMIDEVRHSETDERKERILKRAMDAYVYFSWDQACDMAVLFNQENADKLIRHKVEYVEEWDYCTPDQVSALYDVLSGPVLDLMITKAKGTFSKEQIKKLKEKISLKTLELIDPKCEWDEEYGSSNHYEYDSASAHAPDSRSEPLSDPGFVSALVGETLRLIRQRRKR